MTGLVDIGARAGVGGARSVRSEIDEQLRGAVGAEAMRTARTVLAELLGLVGRAEQVRTRSVPAPEQPAVS